MRIALSLSVLALLVSTAAMADPPPGTIMKVTPPGPSAEAVKACIQQYQLRIARIGGLAAQLKLTPEQKPLFDAWRKVMVDYFHATPCPPPATDLSVPAPERISNQIRMLGMTLDGLRREQPAVEALYAKLSPAQRAMFDGPVGGPPEKAAPAPQAH